jgi:hypothetical protein
LGKFNFDLCGINIELYTADPLFPRMALLIRRKIIVLPRHRFFAVSWSILHRHTESKQTASTRLSRATRNALQNCFRNFGTGYPCVLIVSGKRAEEGKATEDGLLLHALSVVPSPCQISASNADVIPINTNTDVFMYVNH